MDDAADMGDAQGTPAPPSTPAGGGREAPPTTPAGGGREAPPTMPTRRAFLVSFAAVVVAGLLGAVIGYGLVDVAAAGDAGDAGAVLGAVVGAVTAALGVGIVAVLVLRAMSEWRQGGSRTRPGPRRS